VTFLASKPQRFEVEGVQYTQNQQEDFVRHADETWRIRNVMSWHLGGEMDEGRNEGAQLLFQSYGEERRSKLSISRSTCLAFRHPLQPSILARQMVVLSYYVRPPLAPTIERPFFDGSLAILENL
jgi:hypothetical protein